MRLACALVIALASGSVARADEAQDHVDRALRAYNVQDWSVALREYKAAYEIDPQPQTLWAIAQTQRLSGDCRSAILTYKAYLRGASASGANAAERFIKDCEGTVDAQRKALDDQPRAEPAKPPPAPPPVTPVVTPAPAPAKQTAHSSPRPTLLDPLGDVLAIVGVGGLATGTVFLLQGNSNMSAAAAKRPYQAYDKAVDDARTQQRIGVGALVGGGVVAGLAIWRFAAVASHHASASDEHALAPVVVPGGGLVTYGGSF
jgi:hypothetical protein